MSLPSAVANHVNGNSGHAASIAPRNSPTSINNTPDGFKRSAACRNNFLITSSPSAPPSNANRGSRLNSGGSSSQISLGSYGGLLTITS